MSESAYVGWKENTGKTVLESDAFEYATAHLHELDEVDKKDFVEWFFSGNWRKENGVIDQYGRWHSSEKGGMTY